MFQSPSLENIRQYVLVSEPGGFVISRSYFRLDYYTGMKLYTEQASTNA